jgi:hypothetical protein
MINKFCNLLLVLFLTQLLTCCALAQSGAGGSQEEASAGATAEDEITRANDYVSDAINKGKQVILEQKQQLEEKEKPAEEIEDKLEEDEIEARREIYEQEIVEEATMPRPITTLERQLQRERFRRDIMAQAGKEVKTPLKFRKRFHMRASETYDDNLYLTKTDKKKEYTSTLSPSVLFSLTSKYISMDANYVIDIVRYKNRKDLNGTNHLLLTYIRPGSIKLPFFKKRGGKIGIELQDDFQPLVTSVATSEQTERTDRTYNKLFMALDYYMSAKRTLALEYTNVYQSYRSTSLKAYSYTEQILSPTFYFHIRPKWSFFTGYDYGMIDYSEGTKDSTYQRLKGGLTGTLLKKVLAHFESGKEWRAYSDSANGDVQKVFFRSALLDKFTPSTMGSLKYDHSITESTYTGNTYYNSDEINVNLEHKFTYKTIGSCSIKYIQNAYDKDTTEGGETKKRQDQIWEPHLGLKYYVKRWLSTGLDYSYRQRKSNFGIYDYVDNRITGAVNVQF